MKDCKEIQYMKFVKHSLIYLREFKLQKFQKWLKFAGFINRRFVERSWKFKSYVYIETLINWLFLNQNSEFMQILDLETHTITN